MTIHTQERRDRIKALYESGLNYPAIGAMADVQMTARAVGGLVRRMNLAPVKPDYGKVAKLKPSKPLPVVAVSAEAPVPIGEPGDLPENGCLYIAGDTKDFICCGHPRFKARFCEYHAKLSYNKAAPQKSPDEVNRTGAAARQFR